MRLGAHGVVRHLRTLRERLEQLVGRRPFAAGLPHAGPDVEEEAHPRRELEEELPVFDDVARPLEDGRGVLRERLREEVLVPTRVVGSLELHGGRDHIVRELRGLGGERIDRDEQVELPQRVDDALLIGEGRRRVPAADHERAHAVGAGFEDLLGKDGRRQLTHERAHAHAALEAAFPRAHRR